MYRSWTDLNLKVELNRCVGETHQVGSKSCTTPNFNHKFLMGVDGNYTGAKEGGGTMTLENKHLPDHAHITIILTDLRRTSMKELILSLAVVINVLSI